MKRLAVLSAMVLLAAACASGERADVVVAEHAEHQVSTAVELVRTAADGLALTATFTPDGDRMHVYDTDLPSLGIDGFGRPTKFSVVSGGFLATGPAVADETPVMLSVPATETPIPVYPDGPVTLTIPVAVEQLAGERVDVEVSISYMACTSDGGCSPPVTDQRLVGAVDVPARFWSSDRPASSVPSTVEEISSSIPADRGPDPAVVVSEADISDIGLFAVDEYDPERDPTADLDTALQLAAADDREVVAVIGGDWCPDCWYLDAFIDINDELEDSLRESFVFLKVNISDENENAAFLRDYPDFSWVPHMLVFGPNGELADSIDTRLLMTEGRFDEDAFAEVLVARSGDS